MAVTKRGGRWRVVVYAGLHPVTGQRRQLSGSAPTETAARQLHKRLAKQAQLLMNGGGDPTVEQLAAEFWRSNPRLQPTTKANYRVNLDRHIIPTLGDRRISEMRPRLVAAYLEHLAATGMHPATVRKVRTVLSALLAYAVAMEYLDSNPVTKVPPPELDGTKRPAPTIDETARLLLAAETNDADLYTYLWLAAEGGGRRGEVLGLRWRDVDLDAGRITISGVISHGDDGAHPRDRTKTGKTRTVALSSITTQLLRDHRARAAQRLTEAHGHPSEPPADAFVFTGGLGSRRTPVDGLPWRPDSTTRRFRELKAAAGVPASVTLHGLRHTMITEIISAGVDPRTAMGRAGHTTEATTMQVYAAVRPAADAAAAELWGQLLQQKLDEAREQQSVTSRVDASDQTAADVLERLLDPASDAPG
jgi:integrase